MSKKWEREMAHRKAEMLGIKNPNKQRYFQGRPIGSWFSVNWKKIAAVQLPKPPKKSKQEG